MAKTVLEPVSHLQGLSWWREEAKEIKQHNRANGRETSPDQVLGKVALLK